MLRLMRTLATFLRFEISNLIGRSMSISKQPNGWIEALKDSKITGTKFLTNKEREKIAHDREFEEVNRHMEEFRRRHLEMLENR